MTKTHAFKRELLRKLASSPGDTEARRQYAEVLETQGRHQEARRQRHLASQYDRGIDPDFKYYLHLCADLTAEPVAGGEIIKVTDGLHEVFCSAAELQAEMQALDPGETLNDLGKLPGESPLPAQDLLRKAWELSSGEPEKVAAPFALLRRCAGGDAGWWVMQTEDEHYTLIKGDRVTP